MLTEANDNVKRATKSFGRHNDSIEKEIEMETKNTFECGICYHQALAKDFTPITVSANFAALECPNCLNNDEDSFCEVSSNEDKIAA
ncbi:MAG: hypothetical protein GJV46_11660 [Geobacter sp.]|nr:hypothetical protein [Geobacter sp.]